MLEQDDARIPVGIRAHLAHAALQALADDAGVDILHVKGPAVHLSLGRPLTQATDADIVIRSTHVTRFLEVLCAHGWRHVTSFESGSAFEHAATFFHDSWGYVDAHRIFPGLTSSRSFERLWAEHEVTPIAGIGCTVPSLTAQRLLLLLHVARNGRGIHDPDYTRAWSSCTPQEQAEIRALARELRAEVGLAAALGELDHYLDDPTHDLWMVFSTPGATRLQEWKARLKAAPTRSAQARLLMRSILVNTDHLAMRLGRRPTRGEVVTEFFARGKEACAELCALARRRRS